MHSLHLRGFPLGALVFSRGPETCDSPVIHWQPAQDTCIPVSCLKPARFGFSSTASFNGWVDALVNQRYNVNADSSSKMYRNDSVTRCIPNIRIRKGGLWRHDASTENQKYVHTMGTFVAKNKGKRNA